MTFSERAGIAHKGPVNNPTTEDAPRLLRLGVIDASAEAVGWSELRQITVDTASRHDEVPDEMIRWYQERQDAPGPLLECDWWIIYEIIESVSHYLHRSVTREISRFLRSVSDVPSGAHIRDGHAYDRFINTLFRIHNIGYLLSDCEVVESDLIGIQDRVSRVLPVANPSDYTHISRAWTALNHKPDPEFDVVVDNMRRVLENAKKDSWFPSHSLHEDQPPNEPKPATWHMSEVIHHAYRAASKFYHGEATPTKADAVLAIMLGITLIEYREARENQRDELLPTPLT